MQRRSSESFPQSTLDVKSCGHVAKVAGDCGKAGIATAAAPDDYPRFWIWLHGFGFGCMVFRLGCTVLDLVARFWIWLHGFGFGCNRCHACCTLSNPARAGSIT